MRASNAHAFFITVSVLMEPSTDSDHIIDFWLCVLNHSIRSISDARNGAFIWAFATVPLVFSVTQSVEITSVRVHLVSRLG
jgi:hypothetical protein